MAVPDPECLDRRTAWITAVTAALMLAVLSVWLIPWEWLPKGDLVPMPANELFTADQLVRAEQFNGYRRWVSWSAHSVSLLVAMLLGFTPVGARMIRAVMGRWPWWLAVTTATLGVLTIGRIVVLPFSLLLRAQSLEYGLTNQATAAWVMDQAKSLLVAWVMITVVMLVVVGLARHYPRRWFLLAGVLAAALTVAGSFLYPVLVEPLFNDFEVMPTGPLRASVLELAGEEGVQVRDVLVADASQRTTTLNAYVSGLWGTRRVVVYDTLLEQMSPEQAKVVIAHELAHAKNRDVLIGTALGAVGAVFAVALGALILDLCAIRGRDSHGAGDPPVVPLLLALFAVGSLLSSPLTNSVSRALEIRADREAISVTGDGRAFIEMQRELALRAIHDPTPPELSQFWFGSHPTVLERAGLPASMEAAK